MVDIGELILYIVAVIATVAATVGLIMTCIMLFFLLKEQIAEYKVKKTNKIR